MTIKLCFLLWYIFSERHFNAHFKYFFFIYVTVLSYFLLRILATYCCFLLNYLIKKNFTSSIYTVGVRLFYVYLTHFLGEIISYIYCDAVTSRAKKQ